MFVGRRREMDRLETRFAAGSFEFAVFYGRRRVGKTTLINEFIKNKNAIYYMAVEGTAKENLANLSRAVLAGGRAQEAAPVFENFESLFGYIDERCGKERLLFVIDEYPYLAAAYPAISSIIQKHIDLCSKNSGLFLILCGSAMSFMEKQVLGYQSPLYGRRTMQFKIHPFSYFEAKEMLPGYTDEEKAILYGVTGGIPEYLSRIRPEETVDKNLAELFFSESGRLFEEPSNLLKQELREPATYHSIIAAIASGASRMSEIATKTGLESSACSNQINSLISLGLVKKEVPVTEKENSRKTIYRLADSMFVFWYRFVRPNISGIIQGVGELIYHQRVKPQLTAFMGAVFEDMCRQYFYLPGVYEKLPFIPGNLGRWWGNNPVRKCQEEIDIMAFYETQALFGECKWMAERVDSKIAARLMERGELFQFPEKYYYLFSKSGFTEDVCRLAEEKGLHLISFGDMNK